MKNNSVLAHLLTAVTFLLVIFLLSRAPVDADMWWHLRTGQVMWEQKVILVQDMFSYTRSEAPWVNAFWLSDLLLYLLYNLGGYFALTTFVALTGALTFFIVSQRMPGTPFFKSAIIILAAFTAAPIWGPRPQILSFLIVAGLDFWLEKFPSRLWILPPLFALWANLHGGWIWGFLLLIAHGTGLFFKSIFAPTGEDARLRREALNLLMWTAVSAFFLGLNPIGLALWRLPFQQVDVSLQIQEWLSPNFHRADFHPMLWMIFLLLATAPFAVKPVHWSQLFKTLGFAYLTFVAQRNIALFAITAAPLLAEWSVSFFQALPLKLQGGASKNKFPRLASILNALIILLLGLAASGNLYMVSRPERVYEHYPVGAVEWIKANRPAGRLFNSYNWGGYLIWSLPDYPVFIDGRADLYGDELIQQWHDVVKANENALPVLDSWQVNVLLLEPDWPIIKVLKANGWKPVYLDGQAVILTR